MVTMQGGGAQHPLRCGPHCLSRQDSQTVSQRARAVSLTRQIPFVWLCPYLYRTKSFFSPWVKALLLIKLMLKYRTDHCDRNSWVLTYGFYFRCEIGRIKTVERSSFTCRLLSNFLKIQAVTLRFWMKLVWCALLSVPKPRGLLRVWLGKSAALHVCDPHRYRSTLRWC